MSHILLAASNGGPFPWLKPVGDVLRFPFDVSLGFLFRLFHGIPVVNSIGAYGLAIIGVTITVKLILFPLYQTQLRLTRKSQDEQRKVAPELAEIRKKYKKDPQKLNAEMMALYKEHGINPAAPLLGCLPTLAQFPVLIGLYQAIFQHHFLPAGANYFLGLNLGINASVHNPVTWILPVLAGATTFIQSKMFAPPQAAPGEQDSSQAQMAQMTQSMSLIMPVMIVFFAFQSYALQGLVLYWIVGNIFSIFQQYTVNGWGQLPILGKRANKPAAKPDDRKKDERKKAEANGASPSGANLSSDGTTTMARARPVAGSRRKGRRR